MLFNGHQWRKMLFATIMLWSVSFWLDQNLFENYLYCCNSFWCHYGVEITRRNFECEYVVC